jgi:predicted GNAT family acetyltransferase
MSPSIQHDPTNRRFVAHVDGVDCLLEYQLAGTVMTITHTEVPPAVGGRGIAGALVQSALETARDMGWQVVPACSYAAAWIKRHPEYAGLLA